MKKSDFHDPEGNQVMYDMASIIIAGALGGLGAVVTNSPGVGALATGVIAATGIAAMRIDPVQRKAHEAATALSKTAGENAVDSEVTR